MWVTRPPASDPSSGMTHGQIRTYRMACGRHGREIATLQSVHLLSPPSHPHRWMRFLLDTVRSALRKAGPQIPGSGDRLSVCDFYSTAVLSPIPQPTGAVQWLAAMDSSYHSPARQ